MDHDAVIELIRRDVTSDQYEEVRALWKAHSIAEDNRDIPGLMATLTEDCVYELPQTGDRWEGHEGATQFYTQLLGAFPDIEFHLTNIVIGPQGVCEAARATATHQAAWRDRPPTGQPVDFTVVIFFPWDADRCKFAGETVYIHGLDL